MKKRFGVCANGQETWLYTISCDGITAQVSDLGATLVNLFVPAKDGTVADVVLGFDSPDEYIRCGAFFGAVVGRNANRVRGGAFTLNGKQYQLDQNDHGVHNLHSGFDPYKNRMWQVESHTPHSITLRLDSPDGDQGFPGNAVIRVTYALEQGGVLRLVYDAVCDQDTVFNMTNHTYFNLAGHDHPEKSIHQHLCIPGTFFTPDDELSIPTGELRNVEGTPFDFRVAKPISRDIGEDYDALNLQGGYDHNFEAASPVCAILSDPESGRVMEVSTDCPGIQFYCGNFLSGEKGKGGVLYCHRGGVALETDFFPDAVNHPEWKQPFVKANEPYHSETTYTFK